jgi:hypothetical protein
MNKFFLQAAFFSFLLIAIPAHAQTADGTAPADAPADAPAAAPEPAPAPVVSTPTFSAPSTITETALQKGLREGLPLHVRQEQAFDANGNNRLEPDEIKAFLKSVYHDTSAGPVKNTSDILYSFDKNKDGFIDRSEASGFSQYSL